MAATIKLVGGISRDQPDQAERRAGHRPTPRLMVLVGKSDTLRPVELTEDQIFTLAEDAVKMLRHMRNDDR